MALTTLIQEFLKSTDSLHENVKVSDVMHILHGGGKTKFRKIKTFIFIYSIIIKIFNFLSMFQYSSVFQG